MSALSRFTRIVATARHLSAKQLRTRAVRVAERKWHALRRTRAPREENFRLRTHNPAPLRPHMDERSYSNGAFTFLNETRTNPRWDEPSASQLWRYHLHYFDYARELDCPTFVRLAESWIAANGTIRGDGWHPYTLSLRIVNWCDAADAFSPSALPSAILASLYGQARYLRGHLEHDVRGNHLLKNLRALVWAGTFFDGEEAGGWRTDALRMLEVEVAEQVLPDGGHFERAPGYHVQVLRDLDETREFLRRNGLVFAWLDEAVARMRVYLETIVPANGRLPLLKDTVRFEVRDLIQATRGTTFLADSGYAVVRDDARGDHLIADFGKVCPNYLPAHAHADLFSFELTIGGRPVVVDSGVYEYARGEWRDWFRSTAAHNSVVVDRRNQSDVYDSFRVGRRAHPVGVVFRNAGHAIVIQGGHDGYAPAMHHRTIVVIPSQRVWVFVDRVHGPAREVASYVHLHPGVETLMLQPFHARVLEGRGWYSEHFGEKTSNRVLTIEPLTPVCFGYAISAGIDVMVEGDEEHVRIEAGGLAVSIP